jgi:hypothetical protein
MLGITHLRADLSRVADGARLAMGGIRWSRGGEVVSSIGYTITARSGVPVVRLQYTMTRDGTKLDYPVLASSTVPNYGGRRWWWLCPLVGCGRRCGKLYLPPGGRYYGCRQCYRLTYESAQEHDPRVSRLANDPLALYAAMSGAIDDAGDDTQAAIPNLLVALKAYDQIERRERRRRRR